MPDIKLPNGRIIKNVPEGATKEEIRAKAIALGIASESDFQPKKQAQEFTSQQSNQERSMQGLAKEQGMLDTLAISTGRGLTNIGRGIERITGFDIPGIEPEDELEKAGYEALQKERPYSTTTGEVIGETLPFLPAGLATGAIRATAPRVAATAGVGGAEVGTAAAGRGESIENTLSQAGTGAIVAGAIEAAIPVFGKLIGAAYRRLTGGQVVESVLDANGNVIPQVRSALEANGVNVDEIKSQAVKLVQQEPKNLEEATRLARFRSQEIPYTPGDISGDFKQRAKEARLSEIQEEVADPIRNIRTTQARRIGELKDQMAESLSKLDLEGSGDQVKLAISSAENIAKGNRKAAYKQLSKSAGYENGLPLPINGFEDLMINNPDFQGMVSSLTPQERKQVTSLLVEYGIDDTPELVELFAKNAEKGLLGKGSNIKQLTTENAEQFNKSLNAIVSPTSPPAIKGVVGALKRAADDSFDLIDDEIAPELIQLKKAARLSNVALKQDFSPESLAGKLIKMKKDGATPAVEASNVYATLFKPSKASNIDQIRKVTGILDRTTKGRIAKRALQSRLILDVFDAGFSRSSKMNNQPMFAGNQAKSYLDKIGMDGVQELFKGNEKTFDDFMSLLQTGQDITPSSKEIVKGSGSALLNVVGQFANLTQASRLPSVQGVINVLSAVTRGGKDAKDIQKIINSSPKLKKQMMFIQKEMPGLTAALALTGGAVAAKEDEENE